MCGLAGYFDTRDRRAAERSVLERMIGSIGHRGPDSTGFHVDGALGMAFCRLAIVGLHDGDQPLANEDGSVVVCCNGEIFNHQELRDELRERGHQLRTGSDVEVVSHLYEEHGDDLVHRLNGQFSLAVHDRRRRRLLLARDHFGITPLHYALLDGTLVFGSEVKALLAHPAVPREVDLAGLDQILTLPGLVSPRTMFRGISSLPPAHLLVAERGTVTTRAYWDLDYPSEAEQAIDGHDDEAALGRLAAALRASVKLRMRADVEHAYYLSGGLDSSLIIGLAAEQAPGRRLRSFSVAFTEPALSERSHQRVLAEHLRTDHTEIAVAAEDLVDRLPEVVWHCECPLRESYNAASWLLARTVREHGLKVVLTGEGSDELFAGYVGYRFDEMARRHRPGGSPQTEEERLRARLFGNAQLAYQGDLVGLREMKRRLYAPGVGERLDEFDATRAPLVDLERVSGRHVLHQRSYLDVKLRLADHLLGDHGDRMALAHAVEARYPFLDVAVAECARTLPPGLKLHGFDEKFAVKHVARGIVPESIIARGKFAFAADASPALVGTPSDMVRGLLDPARLGREGYFRPEVVDAAVREARAGRAAVDPVFDVDTLMVVLTFGMFLEAFGLS